ncbi:uncharacterized protein TRIVIDRAFT_111685 [Trichoderma virens Gv29-8]|uniref:Uncharacterized protein n=1 Tax=Hypocrea virens (strain Gv29-8 / FGSC 10586) TaxID=413071 RepID=G9N1I7_HYPVG|nr:uncharacterized protein TRIVIDRAFT_111685 [Trichoderma virens Gv29-8]EHK19617.1 hypothetical protein TRIVIDRAFT_111685 [Trichoderma virens Gv29-8]UKZ58128.1 hypothetical protein TrVGV298_011993 [Trichoderma virens]
MPPPKPSTSTSTENLLLKCQKETRKKCLPPEWSIYPPNQPTSPPFDTLALAIQIDASSPSSVTFYESATDRLVGSIGPEYRGSIVIVPWRPGLKFVCQSTCRRRTGCRVGVVREAKARGVPRLRSVGGGNIAIAKSRNTFAQNKNTSAEKKNTVMESRIPSLGNKRSDAAGAENAPPAFPPKAASPTASLTASPTSKSKSGYISRIPRRVSVDKTQASTKHVSFDEKSISGKSSIATDGGGSPKLRAKIDLQPRQRC